MQNGWKFVMPVLFFAIGLVAESLPCHSTGNVVLGKIVNMKSLLSCPAFNPYRSKRI